MKDNAATCFLLALTMQEGSKLHKGLSDEKKQLLKSLPVPALFVIIIWLVKVLELIFDLELYAWGLFPQKLSGLKGIFLAPFIHGDFSHLISNTFPLLILGSALFYFYRAVAFRILILSVFITGFWVWVAGRPSFHIGASGIIYSLAAFLFTSGVIRRHPRLMALSLLVVFLYGGMVWGVLPVADRISWESHLMGLVCGVLLAFYFKAHGPQRKKYSWELEEEATGEENEGDAPAVQNAPLWEEDPFASSNTGYQGFHYHYGEAEKKEGFGQNGQPGAKP